MVKKIYLFYALSLISIAPAFAMSSMSMADIATLTTQLNHINAQMNAIKRAWNIERAHIKMAEKASAALYAQIKPILDRLISSTEFTAQMNTIVTMQFDSIINSNAAFKDIKTDNNLSDLFPNLTMHDYGRKLYKAMANKAYFLLLGQKLAEKAKEIGNTIKNAQQETVRQSIA